MDIMVGARLGRAILVSGSRDYVTASLPRRAAAAAAAGTGCNRARSGASAAARQQGLHASGGSAAVPAGDGRCTDYPNFHVGFCPSISSG